jgi:hypothetical protein
MTIGSEQPFQIAAEPGYVRMVVGERADGPEAVAACREFVHLCNRENAHRGLIVHRSGDDGLQRAFDTVAQDAPSGFKLAIVARHRPKPSSRVRARVFKSELVAAAWLLR